MEIRCIAAVGKNGQIGLNGKLPWDSDRGDLPWFKEQTLGRVVVLGMRTWNAFDNGTRQLLQSNRKIIIFQRKSKEQTLEEAAESLFETLCVEYPANPIYIAGGAKVYQAFLPYYNKFIISRIDYDGPADTYFPLPLLWKTESQLVVEKEEVPALIKYNTEQEYQKARSQDYIAANRHKNRIKDLVTFGKP